MLPLKASGRESTEESYIQGKHSILELREINKVPQGQGKWKAEAKNKKEKHLE